MSDRRLVSLLLFALDFVSVVVVFSAVSWLRGVSASGMPGIVPLLVPFTVVFFGVYLIDGYSPRTDMLSVSYTSLHGIAHGAGMLVMLLVTFVFIKDPYVLQSSRAVIVLSFVLLVPVTLSYRRRLTLRVWARRQQRPILFLGSQASCVVFKDTCATNRMTHEVIFIATDATRHESIAPMIELEMQAISELPAILDRLASRIEAIVLHETSRDLPPAVSEKLMELHFRGVPTYTLELFHEVYWRKIPLYRLNQIWLFQEGFQIAREPVFARLKRLSDIVLALLGLLVFSPLLLLCGLAVWLEDRGPVFFLQTRVGKNRVPFQICKFRTMRPHAESGDPYTRPGDARITRVGRLLRAARLDEFPQLWNVLRGDMSLIGPRAEWIKLVEHYEREIPCYHFRHLMKPGITGWAQVNYPYGDNLDDTLRKLEYDLYYIRYFSFVLDASIVLKTIHIMLFGKGR
jgi:exopolysaccharide biosynthesis polyprenyl glycosylphosphotransferase